MFAGGLAISFLLYISMRWLPLEIGTPHVLPAELHGVHGRGDVVGQHEQRVHGLHQAGGGEGAGVVAHRPQQVGRRAREAGGLEVLAQHLDVLVDHLEGDPGVQLREQVGQVLDVLERLVGLALLGPQQDLGGLEGARAARPSPAPRVPARRRGPRAGTRRVSSCVILLLLDRGIEAGAAREA